MKKLILTLFSIILVTTLHAQFEFSEGINTGLFHYSGSGSAADTYILPAVSGNQYRTYNPYGNKNGWSYGAYAQLQYVTKSGFIFGSQFGYDVLRSKVNVTGDIPYYYYEFPNDAPFTDIQGDGNNPQNASGRTYLQNEQINLSPYIGYRFKAGKVKIDLMPGMDLGFHINSYDKGKGTYTNPSSGTVTTDTADYNLGKAKTDVRLKLGIAAGYKRWNLNLSYAHGLTKFLPYNASPGDYVHTELLRMGLSYRIK